MTRMIAAALLLVAIARGAAGAERPLEADTVIVEGAGVEEAGADLLKMEFLLSVRQPSPPAAYADLDVAADRFAKAVRQVVGTAGEIERGAKTLARWSGPDGAGYVAAAPVTLAMEAFPRAQADLEMFVERVTAGAISLEEITPRVPMPRVYFETRLTRAMEERLAQAALGDAKTRAAAAARLLGRAVRTTDAQAAEFPATVTVEGVVYTLGGGARPVVSDKPVVRIEYVARVAFAAE